MIKIAEKCLNSNALNKINQFTQHFIAFQIQMQPKKYHIRYFIIHDKMFALSHVKQSGKAYSTFSKVFTKIYHGFIRKYLLI